MPVVRTAIAVCLAILSTAPAALAKGGTMKLTTSAFLDGADIPEQYTCDGAGQAPPLDWSELPDGTKSLALIVDDPDAPNGPWVHWLLYDLPPNTASLRPGTTSEMDLPDGAKQGKNDFQKIGYGGPCPPHGTHHYRFTLYALNEKPALESGIARSALDQAMRGHILAQARLTGRYRRR